MSSKFQFPLWLALTCIAAADVRLPGVFSDHMVLQRDKPVTIWGWAGAGEKVTVSIPPHTSEAVADSSGSWRVELATFPAGGPHELTVSGNNTLTFRDVLFGEVWLCSGQSNMQWSLKDATNGVQEVAEAAHPQIRLLTVKAAQSLTPQANAPTSGWAACTPESAAGFSAVGYFFGRHIHQELGVPIGLINSSWGGTICEAWTSATTLKTLPDFAPRVAFVEKTAASGTAVDWDQEMIHWWMRNDPAPAVGTGWTSADYDTSRWSSMTLPTQWEYAGLVNYDGIVWFRKEFTLPETWNGRDLILHLGKIDDMDMTYVNGVKVGNANDSNAIRNYKVPAALLKPGRNVLAVSVLDTALNGGITGPAADMRLELPGATEKAAISLAGEWRYRTVTPLSKLEPLPEPVGSSPNVSTVIHNSMIAPLTSFPIRGVIWYQGESNVSRAHQYRTLFPAMIRDWRRAWGDDIAFGFVQLANFLSPPAEPVGSCWAELREAQAMALKLPNTGMATAIDIGAAGDIHPTNKQDVGRRLALWAQAEIYQRPVVHSGPVYQSMKTEGNRVRITFDHTGSGLEAKGGGPLRQFAIAGTDQKFVWADARIDGDTIVVSSPQAPHPAAVRYAWADNPEGCNLINKNGLPAPPFRTDDWPALTAGVK